MKLSHEKEDNKLSTKNTNKPYIMIPNTIVRNSGISNISKIIYTSLVMGRSVNQTRLYQQISIHGLLGMVSYQQRTENQRVFKEGLTELVKLNAISIYLDFALTKEISPTELKGSTLFFVKFNDEDVYYEDFVNRFHDDEIDKELINYGFKYTTVYIEDLVRLFAIELNHNLTNMLSLYLMTVSRALIGSRGYKYSTETIENITHYANINEKTASSYFTTLFNAKLLYKLTLRQVSKAGEVRDYNVYSR
ncbi:MULTISPECIES: hypothetical protein [Bacillus cereus group]|uniref:hypothetical protein n=1 Tax=Bacillus cereus group TaxID=86661 RepID=UPI001F27AEF5|nr:hypothetical protein [Bacillus cereus]HDR7980558.1 hypothetical protein [Bacillus cereus]HDR8058509.1 hypothetical protein [Bacillus cereus]